MLKVRLSRSADFPLIFRPSRFKILTCGREWVAVADLEGANPLGPSRFGRQTDAVTHGHIS